MILMARQLIFWIRSPVDEGVLRRCVARLNQILTISSFRQVAFYRKIVSHLKHPGSKIPARFAALQMLEQRKEYFLNNLFPVVDRYAGAEQVAQQPVLHLVEQGHHFFFERSRLGRSSLCRGNRRGCEIRDGPVLEHL